MLSVDQKTVGSRCALVDANPLAAVRARNDSHMGFDGGNNLDGGHSAIETHTERAAVSPLTAVHGDTDTHVTHDGGNTLVTAPLWVEVRA